MSDNNAKGSASSIAQAGVRLLKKLVYENYEEGGVDRRQHQRTDVIGDVTISVTDPAGKPLGETRGFVRDSSRGGCAIWTRLNMPVGSTVLVTGTVGEGRQKVQRLGRVKHCRGSEGTGFAIGVQFDAEASPLGKPRGSGV